MLNLITCHTQWRPIDIGNPDADPPIPAIIPVGTSTWWADNRSERPPKLVKLGPRTTTWRVEDTRTWIQQAVQ